MRRRCRRASWRRAPANVSTHRRAPRTLLPSAEYCWACDLLALAAPTLTHMLRPLEAAETGARGKADQQFDRMSVAFVVVGALLVAAVLYDIFLTVVVPRPA